MTTLHQLHASPKSSHPQRGHPYRIAVGRRSIRRPLVAQCF